MGYEVYISNKFSAAADLWTMLEVVRTRTSTIFHPTLGHMLLLILEQRENGDGKDRESHGMSVVGVGQTHL